MTPNIHTGITIFPTKKIQPDCFLLQIESNFFSHGKCIKLIEKYSLLLHHIYIVTYLAHKHNKMHIKNIYLKNH